VGSAATTRRTTDAWNRSRRINGGQVHDQEAGATLPGVEDIPAQSRRWDRVHRSVRGANDLVQAALWPGNSSPRKKAIGEHQRDEQSDHRVNRGTGD